MKELQQFPECGGHIERILIGMKEQNSVFGDISEYTVAEMNDGFIQYAFFDVNPNLVLSILARSVRIFEIGGGADINVALFDVGNAYIGGQYPE